MSPVFEPGCAICENQPASCECCAGDQVDWFTYPFITSFYRIKNSIRHWSCDSNSWSGISSTGLPLGRQCYLTKKDVIQLGEERKCNSGVECEFEYDDHFRDYINVCHYEPPHEFEYSDIRQYNSPLGSFEINILSTKDSIGYGSHPFWSDLPLGYQSISEPTPPEGEHEYFIYCDALWLVANKYWAYQGEPLMAIVNHYSTILLGNEPTTPILYIVINRIDYHTQGIYLKGIHNLPYLSKRSEKSAIQIYSNNSTQYNLEYTAEHLGAYPGSAGVYHVIDQRQDFRESIFEVLISNYYEDLGIDGSLDITDMDRNTSLENFFIQLESSYRAINNIPGDKAALDFTYIKVYEPSSSSSSSSRSSSSSLSSSSESLSSSSSSSKSTSASSSSSSSSSLSLSSTSLSSSSSSSSSFSGVPVCLANDDFNLPYLSWRWYVESDPSNMISISSGKLNFYYSGTSSPNANIRSDYVFESGSGFDIQIDFSDLAASGNGGIDAKIYVANLSETGLAQVGVEYNPYVSEHNYFAGDYGSVSETYSTTHFSGKFRLTRTSDGSEIVVYIWSGSQWEWNGDTDGLAMGQDYSSVDLILRIQGIIINYGGTVTGEVNFDNFVVNDGCENISSLSSSSSSS